MPFLGLLELLIVGASIVKQSMPSDIRSEVPLQKLEPFFDQKPEVLPFVIEGSVESLDPIQRAKELALTISRRWCGNYRSFNNNSTNNVTLLFSQIKPIGQIVSFYGQLIIDEEQAKIRGSLNAKSNQVELMVLSNYRMIDLESGGTFVGLYGLKRLLWNSPKLNDLGGIINLNDTCGDKNLKT